MEAPDASLASRERSFGRLLQLSGDGGIRRPAPTIHTPTGRQKGQRALESCPNPHKPGSSLHSADNLKVRDRERPPAGPQYPRSRSHTAATMVPLGRSRCGSRGWRRRSNGEETLGRLLVSVRGPNEAVEAARGGAHIIDVEYPGSALGTPYPLNIKAVRERLDAEGFKDIPISTNIGEQQLDRASGCQAALGVAVAGADYVKCGLAGLGPKAAAYLGRNLVRTVREWRPDAKVFPAVFPEEEFSEVFDPVADGPRLVEQIGCDGLLIDTYQKDIGKGLMDYYTSEKLTTFVEMIHGIGKEGWLAGSLTREEIAALWSTGVDVICVRGAACAGSSTSRFGAVTADTVSALMSDRPCST